MKVVKEEDDVVLRFSELPCPAYDKTVNKVRLLFTPKTPGRLYFSQTKLKIWFDTFLETPVFKVVLQNIQQHFNPGSYLHGSFSVATNNYCFTEYWKLKAEDVVMFYRICIHETSILGKSQ